MTDNVKYVFVCNESAAVEQKLNMLAHDYIIKLENPRYWHDVDTTHGTRSAMMAVMLKLTAKN